MKQPEILFLQQEDVIAAGVLDMALVFPAVERSFRLHGLGQVQNPEKTTLLLNDNTGQWQSKFVAMPVYLGENINRPGLKWAAESMANLAGSELPMGIDLLILSDAQTVAPVAIMDGTLVTAMRTSAAAGVAAKYLANPGTSVVGLVGAGVIGRTLLQVLPLVFPQLKQVKLYDRNLTKAADLAAETGYPVEAVTSAEAAVVGSEAVFTMTTARSPIVLDVWLAPGCFYAQMGACEAEEAVVLHTDRLVVDDWDPIKHHPASVFHPLYERGAVKDSDVTLLRDIVVGKVSGRQDPAERILFASRGLGGQDMVVAEQIYTRAKAMGIGQKLALWDQPKWL